MLFDLNIHNAVDDPETHNAIRVCSTGDAAPGSPNQIKDQGLVARQMLSFNESDEADSRVAHTSECGETTQEKQEVHLAQWGAAASSVASTEIAAAADHLSRYFGDSDNCGVGILFA